MRLPEIPRFIEWWSDRRDSGEGPPGNDIFAGRNPLPSNRGNVFHLDLPTSDDRHGEGT